MALSAEKALDLWEKKGLLAKKKADELRKDLDANHPSDVSQKAIGIFSAIGAVLVGLGVLLFVGSNWFLLNPMMKVALLLAALVGSAWFGYHLAFEKKTYPKTGMAFLFSNVFIYGASIFLIGQIYNLPLTFWWGALLWFLGTFFFAYALRSRLHIWLAVPIFLLFLGWLRTTTVTGFMAEVDFLFGRQSLFSIFALIGTALLSLGVLHNRFPQTRFASKTLYNWGFFLILTHIVIGTLDKSVLFGYLSMPQDTIALVTAVIAALLIPIALMWGQFLTKDGRWALLSLGLYVAGMYALVEIPTWKGFTNNNGIFMGDFSAPLYSNLYILYVLLSFVFLFLVVWFGTLMKRPAVINMGIIGIAISIFIQYFSFAFALLDRSFAFILGGLLILGVSAALEKQRQKIIRSLNTPKKK